ncbi:tumor protein p53-inducible protein 13 isoform X2 [Hypomesus transpacificus]|uniref:tumor protein p53-inducible protein 13 isoform X2 n=1 Tax=Hypomesus transpacificus TaxID=137520 RepID=UPI001F0718FC|nr:tumor protein p53-inducible protein 13 isoform X2 [Hypomesus transpacificus]
MSPPVVALLSALFLYLGLEGGAVWQGCDSGKLLLQIDLPPSAVWSCPGPVWPESTLKNLSGIDTQYPPQPARQVCIDTPITLNHSIPNSGAHRPVGGESGEYLYCPPQRWLNNLQHGATVLLYHPCAPVQERVRLAVLARSCLSSYIITPHPDLSTHRMFAVVSWGRTLELSSVTGLEVCDWLEATASGVSPGDVVMSQRYSLLLTRPAVLHHDQDHGRSSRTLRHCCLESLSLRRNGGMVGKMLFKRRERARVRRAAVQKENNREEKEVDEKVVEKENKSILPFPTSSWINRTDPSGNPGAGNQEQLTTAAPHLTSPGALRETAAGRVEVQEREVEPDDIDHSTAPQTHKKKAKTGHHHPRQGPPRGVTRQRTDSKTTVPPEGAIPNDRMPTARTDEAVWAAAALGFLLVLLALSVLHTRLYRHWRTTPSLYWHNPQQDYDNVADIIRRRLRVADRRRKRRWSLSRRQECSLLPSSSTDEDH